jgi:hypothetical protein
MDAIQILEKAAETIRERGKTYDPNGERERSMGQIVAMFNIATGHNLTEQQGWLFMQLLKIVRANMNTTPHQDSLLDLVAYSALGAECVLENRRDKNSDLNREIELEFNSFLETIDG